MTAPLWLLRLRLGIRRALVRRVHVAVVRAQRVPGYPPRLHRLSYVEGGGETPEIEVWHLPVVHLLARWWRAIGGRWCLHRLAFLLGIRDTPLGGHVGHHGTWRLDFWRVHAERLDGAYVAGYEAGAAETAAIIRDEQERARRIARIRERGQATPAGLIVPVR